jgi:hypothetical protein
MADTDINLPETVADEPLKNDALTTAAPTKDNNVNQAEVARLRREVQEAQMWKNKATQLEQAQQEQTRKSLEEKEEFKTLYEQTQSKLNEIQEAQASQERQAQLKTATEEVFKNYSADAVELAKTAGLGLSEDSDTARASLKEKLDAFQAKVGGSPQRPGANNPRQTTSEVVERSQLTARNADGVSPLALAQAKGDDSVLRQYVRGIPAIERMKEIARNGA